MSLVNLFRSYQNDRYTARHYFWDHFDWNQHSIWIGRFNDTNHLPQSDSRIIRFMEKIARELMPFQDQMYAKFYFSRQKSTNQPIINYLIVSDQSELPLEFEQTLAQILFEKYQITQKILDQDSEFKRLINHYFNWSDFYTGYQLTKEIEI